MVSAKAKAISGIKADEFDKCLSGGKKAALVNKQFEDAVKTGGQGTPWSIIVGPGNKLTPIFGSLPTEKLNEQIDALLK